MIRVTPITNGVVIDHLPVNSALRILELLDIRSYSEVISVGLNLHSHKEQRKDLIKIEGRVLTTEDIEKIALFGQHSTINIIENEKVVKKIKPTLPGKFVNTFNCPNPSCVTNHEYMNSVFYVKSANSLQCKYCERTFSFSGMKVKQKTSKI
ncbi:MAG: aspartate carbamoyltransferase regulatory subunit [Candidatus Woesearchaeota archaeon]